MSIKLDKKTPMPMLDPIERSRVFREVNLGYDDARAIFEAHRCLECQEPDCEQGCPVRVPIQKMAKLVSEGNFEGPRELHRLG